MQFIAGGRSGLKLRLIIKCIVKNHFPTSHQMFIIPIHINEQSIFSRRRTKSLTRLFTIIYWMQIDDALLILLILITEDYSTIVLV